jgi:hypothetical protein
MANLNMPQKRERTTRTRADHPLSFEEQSWLIGANPSGPAASALYAAHRDEIVDAMEVRAMGRGAQYVAPEAEIVARHELNPAVRERGRDLVAVWRAVRARLYREIEEQR